MKLFSKCCQKLKSSHNSIYNAKLQYETAYALYYLTKGNIRIIDNGTKNLTKHR